MSKILNTAAKPFRWFTNAPLRFALPTLAAIAFVLNLILEICGRKSIVAAAAHAFTSPLVFISNMAILFATLSLCLLVKRRIALLSLFFILWLAMGVTNAIVLLFRSSPLSAIDFLIIKDAINVLGAYFSVVELILLGALIIAAIALIVLLFIKCPRGEVNYPRAAISVGVSVIICALAIVFNLCADVSANDLIVTYEERGFVSSFTRSIFIHGVSKPSDDMKDKANELMEQLSKETEKEPTDVPVISESLSSPNIVVVQLESFFDVKYIKDIEFSKDPIPNFTRLKEEGISGFLKVAHIGGGTANIEFEFLTGMNLEHFGLGEFPYTTVLKSRACETLATNLKPLGYTAHALHNHIATFYGRNTVYPYLGFNTFTSIEVMPETKRNILGWASDSILADEIKSALDSTDTQDFVFTVSVQGHGGYPDHSVAHVVPPTEDDVDVYGFDGEKIYYQYHFYCNLIRQMDEAVGDICDMLDSRGEPYILVLYGDHLPAIPLTKEQLENNEMYETEYVIKTNMTLPAASEIEDLNELDRNLETYQLGAYVLSLLGISEGDITKLHQHEFETGESFDDVLKTLTYQQLYEDKALYEPVKMTFGTKPIIIESYSMSGDTLYVTGSGFNRYSKVKIDGNSRSTTFVDGFTLKVDNINSDFDELDVVQTAEDGTELAYAVKTPE